MRRSLLAAVAVAPLLAGFAGAAFAACPSGPSSTSGSDITLLSGCTVAPTSTAPGVTVNSSNNVTSEAGASISNTDVSNTVAIEALSGNTGSVDNESSIALLMSYAPATNSTNGLANGVFAMGQDKYGILVTGVGTFVGNITDGTGGSITIQGNDSYGISIDNVATPTGASLTGSIISAGTISMTGDHDIGINIGGGGITGDLTFSGAISSTGIGAQGIVTSAPIGGAVTLGGTITTTGYRSTTASTNTTQLASLTADQVEQGGSAVVIGGDVAGGVALSAATESTGTAPTTTAAGSLSTFGSAPALQIGAAGAGVTVGNTAADPYGLVIGGSINADGVYEPKTSPNLPGQVDATGVLIGSDGTGTTDLTGGIHVTSTGSITSIALSADSTALHLAGGVTSTEIKNDGSIVASGTINGASIPSANVDAILIDSGATVNTITNNRSIQAVATPTADALSANVGAIIDESGTLATIDNTGAISATTTPSSNLFHTSGTDIAIDVSHSTTGVTISQTQAIPEALTGSISGTTLTLTSGTPEVGQTITGAGVTTGTTIVAFTGTPGQYIVNTSQTVASEAISAGDLSAAITGTIQGNTLTVTAVGSGELTVGQTVTGKGILPGTVITAVNGTATGGVGSYTVNQSQTVFSEDLTAVVAPSITGDIVLGTGHNVFDVEAGSVQGGLSEVVTQVDGSGHILSTSRDLDVTVDNAVVDITTAQLHQVTSLNVGATGVLQVAVDPTFAITGTDPTPIFDTTIHTINSTPQAGPDGTATFADGARIGISLDAIQGAFTATYVIVHTSGIGQLSVGDLGGVSVLNAPFLYTATAQQDGGDLDVILQLKSASQLGFNKSESAAYNAVFAAAQNDSKIGDALVAQTTQSGLTSLYDQLLPDQNIGTFEALEAATQQISQLTGQVPDAGTHIAGGSAWLQEVNQRVDRETDNSTLGSNDSVLGMVAGYERSGAGGGAVGLTLAYLNISDVGSATSIGGHLVTDVVEGGAYYRRAIGGFTFSARGAGGYTWFNERRVFLTTGVSESSEGQWNGFFGDAHAGASYEAHFGRFYVRPELSVDYLYMKSQAHSDVGGGTDAGVNLNVASQVSSRLTGEAILTLGTQYGQGAWFRPEIFGGYREIFENNLGDTVATFNGGTPFTLTPDDSKGGWLTFGFALKGGTDLSYVAIEGDADFRPNEQRFDVFLSGRTLF